MRVFIRFKRLRWKRPFTGIIRINILIDLQKIRSTAGWKPGYCLICLCRWYLVVEEADLQDVLHAGGSVGHAEVAQRIAHQDDVGVVLLLLEVLCVPQGALAFVVHVDQLAFEALQDALPGEERQQSGGVLTFYFPPGRRTQLLTLSSKSMKLETTLTLGW